MTGDEISKLVGALINFDMTFSKDNLLSEVFSQCPNMCEEDFIEFLQIARKALGYMAAHFLSTNADSNDGNKSIPINRAPVERWHAWATATHVW